MTEQFPIPDTETRRREVEKLRECNRQLELYCLQLEEFTAIVESDLRLQRRKRLENKNIL